MGDWKYKNVYPAKKVTAWSTRAISIYFPGLPEIWVKRGRDRVVTSEYVSANWSFFSSVMFRKRRRKRVRMSVEKPWKKFVDKLDDKLIEFA
jgi:hypothetical protein